MQNFPFLSRRRRIDRLFFSILVVVALFLPTACNKGESGLFFLDPAQPIQVKNGQAFVIALPSEQVETHEWQLAQDVDPGFLQLTAAKQTQLHYVNTPDDERGQEFWIFMPTAPGTTTIALNYATPAGEVAEAYVFTVEIR